MSYQKRQRNWKRLHPNSLREAFRLCKEFGRERKNLSVERIAELMDSSPDALYKWLSNASMPSGKIASYEHICGIHYVSEYLAAGANRVVIEIPSGRRADALELTELQAVMSEALSHLIRYYKGEADQVETEGELTEVLKGVAWHRENVHRNLQPEFELGGHDE
jgi:transcriptional regulator with XRE-family HTH domain